MAWSIWQSLAARDPRRRAVPIPPPKTPPPSMKLLLEIFQSAPEPAPVEPVAVKAPPPVAKEV